MIRIRVISFNGQPPAQTLGGEFDESGGTIGRAETNDLVLPDPDRHVSRVQARLSWRDGQFEILNVGANALDVGGHSIANGSAIRVQHGDRITMGGYVLEVEAAAGGASTGRASPAAGAVVSSGPVDDPLGLFGVAPPSGAGGGDPFADILQGAGGARPLGARDEPVRPAAGVIPDDFDPFADPFAPPPPPTEAAEASLDDLGFGPSGESGNSPGIDALFGLGAPAPSVRRDPFAGGALAEPPPGATAGGEIVDPLAALSGAPLPAAGAASIADDVPAIRGAYTPPAAVHGDAFLSWEHGATESGISKETVEPQTEIRSGPVRVDVDLSLSPAAQVLAPAFAQPASAPPAATPAVAAAPDVLPDVPPGSDAMMRAFLAGLGVADLPLPQGMSPELMERIGRLLREAAQGTLDLLLARAMTKREVRAEVTMIVSRDNNPLKFSPSVEVALAHLLAPRGKGFMPPVDAMRDAYDDLRSHQLGFMAGMRAALAGVLQRFDPTVLEQRLTAKSMLDSLLPMNRRAKLWDLYTELYRDIASEAEDDFHALFGREFLRAYEEQVKRADPDER
jgi:FHA domain-containing protein